MFLWPGLPYTVKKQHFLTMLITVIFWLWPKNPLYWHFWISDFKFLNEILPTSAGGSAPRPPLSFLVVSQYWPKFQLFFVPFSGVAAWTTAAAGTWKRRTLNTREMADFSILFELVLVRRFVAWKWVLSEPRWFFYILTLTFFNMPKVETVKNHISKHHLLFLSITLSSQRHFPHFKL